MVLCKAKHIAISKDMAMQKFQHCKLLCKKRPPKLSECLMEVPVLEGTRPQIFYSY